MRIPIGAPIPLVTRIQQKFTLLQQMQKPSLGSVSVITTVILTSIAVFAVTAYPKLNNQYYKDAQKRERAMITATQDELAHGQRVWSDPFDRDHN
ncbi:hypothetical protein L596_000646 [Steinernema carpocapsae]|uniref:Uncharacterized protein n=1 Tax=Steinernema carpocapsae TaxID=34508 RepID=A0A4U8UL50_STECR|nr:hypothetical protein L596_000646 [Steinernema carpocapsae]